MSQKSEQAEREVLDDVADRYRRQGYHVSVRPHASALPGALTRFQVDLVATRGEDQVIVEVKRGKTTTDITNQLAELTTVAQALGWRVDLVSEPEPEGMTWSRARRRSVLEDALSVLDDGHKEAAILLASSALEGALRAMVRKNHAMSDRPTSIRQLIDLLRSNGIVGASTSNQLSRLAEARSRATHAQAIGRFPTASVRDSIRLALWLDDPKYATPDEMVDWFFDRFEDPAEWVPYESREGGYQYPPGEPHDAREVLTERYPDAPEPAIDDALDLIEPLGTEWVRKR